MKKIISILCAVTLSLGMCSGCGETKKTAGSEDKINLRFSFWEPSTGKEMETALEGIVNDYEADHPNVNIELVSQPVGGYQDWIKAQMAVDDLPEIEFNYGVYLIQQYKQGSVLSIEEELNSPNPYNKDQIWKDTFIEGSLDGAHEYVYDPVHNIPLFRTGIAMFYNKTMYKELGLEIPENWNEFMANCEKIQQAGKTPIAMMGQKNDALDWLYWELIGGLSLERWLADPNLNHNGDSYLSGNEVTKAILEGTLDFENDKALQEDYKKFLEYVEQYLKYSPNASGLDEAAAKTIFLSGNAAHLNSGSWDIVGLLMNDEIGFDMGVFKYPHLTKENSEYAGKGISNNCVQTVAITSSVNKQEGAKEAAADFLMYLTAPEQYTNFVTATYQIPSVKDVDAGEIFDAFMEPGYPLCMLYKSGNSSAGRTMYDVYKSTVTGTAPEINDELFKEFQKTVEYNREETAQKNGWTKENNYLIDELPIIGGKFGEN